MNTIRRFLHAGKRMRAGSSRFDRYYGSVLEDGAGYPTADEARQDMRNHDQSFTMYGWPR